MNRPAKDASLLRRLADRANGDETDPAQMLETIYPELRRIAARQMLSERVNHTLQATALVNEAFIRLSAASVDVQDTIHLKALLAVAMRRVLLDHGRAKSSEKRGGKLSIVVFDDQRVSEDAQDIEVENLYDALEALEEFDQRAADAISLHYFGGMTYAEISDFLSVSEATVHKDLRMARAWLASQIRR